MAIPKFCKQKAMLQT